VGQAHNLSIAAEFQFVVRMPTPLPELEQRPTSAPAPAGEAPVFAAVSARRRRMLRAASAGAGGLAAAWLIALALGVFGFDALPDVALPGEAGNADAGEVGAVKSSRSASATAGEGDATRSSAAAAIARLEAKPAARADRGSERTRRASANGADSGATTAETTASAPAPTASAQAPATAPPAAPPSGSIANGRGRPAAPGDRRSPTATGGPTATVAPTPTATTQPESPGRSGAAPGHNR